MNIEKRYDCMVEKLNHYASQWWSFPVFLFSLAGLHLLLGVTVANYYISTVTVAFFFLFNYGQRKDSLANQLKHNAEIEGTPELDDRFSGIEKMTLSELEEKACD
jgi:hypothetical protein